jgi:hypothetical protein
VGFKDGYLMCADQIQPAPEQGASYMGHAMMVLQVDDVTL